MSHTVPSRQIAPMNTIAETVYAPIRSEERAQSVYPGPLGIGQNRTLSHFNVSQHQHHHRGYYQQPQHQQPSYRPITGNIYGDRRSDALRQGLAFFGDFFDSMRRNFNLY